MKNLSIIAFVGCVVIACPTAVLAQPAVAGASNGSNGVSVLVNLTPLKKGSLPFKITAYGRVVSSQKARRTLAAPVAAEVQDVDVQEGQTVSKGEPLVTLVPSPSTRSEYRQAQLEFKVSKQLFTRSQQLAAAHLETAAQLAQDKKSVEVARAKLQALQEEGANGPHQLKAPFHSVVMKISASSGSFVAQGDPVIELARPKGLVFKTGLVPEQAMQVKVGNPAVIIPFSGGGTYKGAVVLRGSVVDPTNGLVPIEISLPDSSLLSGEMGEVKINTGMKHGYVVPHSAILLNPDGHPYVVQSIHGVAKIIPITELGSEDGMDVVQGNFVAGAAVVTAGNYQLDNGVSMHTASSSGSASPASGGSGGSKGQ